MSEPYIAQIAILPYNFAPYQWAFCQGQVLSISQNTALFSLIGTTYGGDGRTSTGLPDFSGRVGIQSGTGPGLYDRRLGQKGGAEQHTLSQSEMAAHTHDFVNQFGPALDTMDLSGNYLTDSRKFYAPSAKAGESLAGISGQASTSMGGGQPHENRMPCQVLNFCIALTGVYPARN